MRVSFRALVAGGLLVVLGCASTNLTSVWKAPTMESTPFNKVTVIVMAQDPAMRRIAEDAFVGAMKKDVVATASYTTFGDLDMKDVEAVKAKVIESGAQGAVVYRLIGVEDQTSYVPGTTYMVGSGYPYYGSFGGYYGYASTVVYEPGYLVTDTVVQIETNTYSVSDQKLIWTARSETINPASATSLIDDVVVATVGRMRQDKIIR